MNLAYYESDTFPRIGIVRSHQHLDTALLHRWHPITTRWSRRSRGLAGFFDFLGFQRLSDEEYLVKLRATRDRYLRQIAALEKDAKENGGDDSSKSGDSL